MSDSMDCTCLIVTGNVPVSIPFINRTLAISLPRMCKNSVPLQCKATGVTLPSPGPALFAPTQAPIAHAPHAPHAHSPKVMQIHKAEATEEEFKECYNTCHKECSEQGNGYTFCEIKCDTDCGIKEVDLGRLRKKQAPSLDGSLLILV
ncbi:AAI domain-containing protein [Forsythia ovata]|uniref:AAI domain-containing protein n=1 Tax=Forsythia ovata TaxID=205694 RepID=A0ABD1VDJ5_9LAMI